MSVVFPAPAQATIVTTLTCRFAHALQRSRRKTEYGKALTPLDRMLDSVRRDQEPDGDIYEKH